MEDDFLLDEDDLEEQYLADGEGESDDDDGSLIEEKKSNIPEKKAEDYRGKISDIELRMSSFYNDIIYAASKDNTRLTVGGGRAFDAVIVDAVRTIYSCNPVNTSTMTVEKMVMEAFQAQGHNRIVSTLYTPDKPLRGSDLSDDYGGLDDNGYNERYAAEARDQIARFIEYLATRDLSKDSIMNQTRKQRQLPAFLIFLFSAGLYDLIIDCPTMPKEYDEQVKRALREISKRKDIIVEALANRYEEQGRTEVAARVRKLGPAWFDKEPADIRTTSDYADLHLTQQDVITYREFRSRFTNISKTLTQETVSDMIEMVVKEGEIYRKLKDKTRAMAITDVKQEFKNWAKANADVNIAKRVIWNKLDDNEEEDEE